MPGVYEPEIKLEFAHGPELPSAASVQFGFDGDDVMIRLTADGLEISARYDGGYQVAKEMIPWATFDALRRQVAGVVDARSS